MMLFTPDNFKRDWYGWITNQWAHVMLGQMLFGLSMIATLLIDGEFASRIYVLAGVAFVYFLWELFTFKPKQFWDAVEDFFFVVIYGAGWVAACFSEVVIGHPTFHSNVYTVLPIVGLFAFHSTLGVLFRVIDQGRA